MKNAIAAKKQEAADLAATQTAAHEKSIRQRLRATKKEGAKKSRDELWKKLSDSADRLQEGQAGYDTGIAAWMAVVTHLKLVVAFHHGSIFENFLAPVLKPLGKKLDLDVSLGATIDSVRHGTVFHNIKKAFVKNWYGVTIPTKKVEAAPVDISDFKLQHFIEYKKAVHPATVDTLNIDSLTGNLRRSDGEQFTAQEAQLVTRCFKGGIDLWLDNQGYEPDPAATNAYYLKTDNNVHLTKEAFEGLRDDPALGLNEFLSGRFDLNISQSSGPRP